jgi:hypothetical protein
VLGFLAVFGYYFSDVLRGQKSYEVTVERGDVDVVISSEEAIREQMHQADVGSAETEAPVEQPFTITVLNATEVPGAASRVALDLEKLGYLVAGVEHDPEAGRQRSAIIFDEGLEDVALTMSRQLGNMLISKGESTVQDSNATSSPSIRIVVGADRDE